MLGGQKCDANVCLPMLAAVVYQILDRHLVVPESLSRYSRSAFCRGRAKTAVQ